MATKTKKKQHEPIIPPPIQKKEYEKQLELLDGELAIVNDHFDLICSDKGVTDALDSIKVCVERLGSEISELEDGLRQAEDDLQKLQDEAGTWEEKERELNNTNQELLDELECAESINSYGVIKWEADNLVDRQIMEALSEAIGPQGNMQHKVLEMLENLVKQ